MRWNNHSATSPEQEKHLQEVLGVDPTIARLLLQRGIRNFEEAKAFFRPKLSDLHDPFLMKDMSKAVNRVLQAIENKEKIMVYGDYDVDGTTSIALVFDYLTSFYELVIPYVPDRYEEGYGVSFLGIDRANEADCSLIIALDCGIKAIDKVAYAKEKGIDFIICDHHRPGEEVPDAIAILNPKQDDCPYPYKELCGCGVGFKLIQALHQKRGLDFNDLIPSLDLVATAIGADIVPITGENRVLAYYGLEQINTKSRPGFKAIIEFNKKQFLDITDVVFIIAPRINAAGRMKHGLHAVELLIEKNYSKAKEIATSIEHFNKDRRDTDKHITQEALHQIETLGEQNNFTSVVYQENWHKGVIGIVASRMTETYYRPTLVFTKSGDKLAASARSVKGFDVYNALEASAEYIEQFGGHMYAAGLTLKEENYEAFKQKFEEVVKNSIDPKLLEPEICYEDELNFSQITPKFNRILKQFAPFGPSNMSPLFLARNVKDTGFAKTVGSDGSHLKATLFQKAPGARFDAIGFGLGEKLALLQKQAPVDIIFSIEENEWNGNVRLQLRLRDIKKSEH